ncbi:MAG TPA: phosphatidylserine/phosphatidylglycerophosphate/cardiolipin synthase family protein [Thermoleophilaceae bacterium]|nr:phosphatidylserine/phosphatidylglycerophosphate/cardiolipin synthase family protein [Thermoleophilaceae bacterium]
MGFIEAARKSLELALYDVRLPGEIGDLVADSIRAAKNRGVEVRLVYNEDHENPIPVPAPPSTEPAILQTLGVPIKAVPGHRDLMHHKYVIRDGRDVWTGSMNWTLDSWTRQENVIALVSDGGVAQAFRQNFEELWRTAEVDGSGNFDSPRAQIRAWFCPGRGEDLSQHIAGMIHHATRRIRIASPVITTSPILAMLAHVVSDNKVDVAGVVDGTQMEQVYGQWYANGNAAWKLPLIKRVFERAEFSGKESTPYAPDTVHDYMHAKVTVCDDVTFIGSFNLSHSGEQNAENVLEIHDPQVADRMATFIDGIRARYPRAPLPAQA